MVRKPPKHPAGEHPVERITDLTPAQRRVAKLLAQGKFNSEVAAELGCSEKTIDTHRGAILSRLGLRNNAELALKAVTEGVVSVDLPYWRVLEFDENSLVGYVTDGITKIRFPSTVFQSDSAQRWPRVGEPVRVVHGIGGSLLSVHAK